MTAKADPQTPAWVLDAVEGALHHGDGALIDAMLAQDEDVSDNLLWLHRRSQFLCLLVNRAEAILAEYRKRGVHLNGDPRDSDSSNLDLKEQS